ncbi:hypothetical protein CGZ80_24610 [Rhodopirellula sp. MGV]|nr:hypothetical protein CGZ80_24610 [Rhodopirellula sp. MGV]
MQVAMVLLAIATSGLFSLSVVATRQSVRLQNTLPPSQTISINPNSLGEPAEAAWARKLGVFADLEVDERRIAKMPTPFQAGFDRVVDNSGPNFYSHHAQDSQPWQTQSNVPDSFGNTITRLSADQSHGSFAAYVFSNVPDGEYELLLHVPRSPDFGVAVRHRVYFAGSFADTIDVDQTVDTRDTEIDGLYWQRLGVYHVRGSMIAVQVIDTPGSGPTIVCDAVRLRSRRSFDIVAPPIQSSDGSVSVTVELN